MICAIWSTIFKTSSSWRSHSATVSASCEASLLTTDTPSSSSFCCPKDVEFRAWKSIVLRCTRKRYLDCVVDFNWFSLSSSAGKTVSRFSSVRSRTKDSLADERMALATILCSSWESTVPTQDIRKCTRRWMGCLQRAASRGRPFHWTDGVSKLTTGGGTNFGGGRAAGATFTGEVGRSCDVDATGNSSS